MQETKMPRKPTEQELRVFADEILLHSRFSTIDEAYHHALEAYIAVFDHFEGEQVQFTGKVMMVIWDGDFGLYIWRNGIPQLVNSPLDTHAVR